MFLINTKDGKSFSEGQQFKDPKDPGQLSRSLTWDDISKDVRITSLQLTYPFPVKFKKPDGSMPEEVTPKLTLNGFDRYFFFNEATIPLLVQGEKILREGISTLEAKTIAGIDDKAGLVFELRMDKWGNCNAKKYSLKALEKSIKDQIFRGDIIRQGG